MQLLTAYTDSSPYAQAQIVAFRHRNKDLQIWVPVHIQQPGTPWVATACIAGAPLILYAGQNTGLK